MFRSTASKVVWLGRATVFLVGLAVILALTVGAVSKATAHTGSAGLFHLAHSNAASALSSLVGTVSNGMLQVTNNSTATTATGLGVTNKSGVSPAVRATNAGGGPALGLNVGSGKAPMTVSAGAAKVNNLDADKVDGKSSEQFANAAHAHSGADVSSGTVAEARIDGSIARDSEVGTALSGKANTTHQHSGADISSGTVEADRIEDGAGSNLNADQLDGLNSTDLTVGMATANGFGSSPTSALTFLAPTAQVTVAAGQAVHVTSNKAFGSTVSGGGLSLNLFICFRATDAQSTVPIQQGGGVLGLRVGQNERTLMGLSHVITGLQPGTYDVGLCGYSSQPATWNSNEWGYTTAMIVKPSVGTAASLAQQSSLQSEDTRTSEQSK